LNIIGLVLTMCGIIWGINALWRYMNYEITNDAYIDQYMSPINARVSGYINDISFVEHSYVRKGDTLLTIDSSEYKIKVLEAKALLAQAIAKLDGIQASLMSAESNIAVAKANIMENEAWCKSLDDKAHRYKLLYAQNAISKQEYEQSVADIQASLAKTESLKMLKVSKEYLYDEIRKEIALQQAVIHQKKAELAMAELNLSYTSILAPRNGYTGRRTCDTGQLIQAGQTITNLIDSDNKWITANYKETQIANLYIGQEVSVKIDAIKNKSFKGRITAISEATGSKYSLLPVDNSAGNFVKVQQRIPVRINFEDISAKESEQIKAGMMVIVEAKIKS
ncbi:MAG: HlyD family secretion protein, partial [Bacteroidales bacterium]